MITRLRRRMRSDAGASLVLVLILLAFTGLAVGSVLRLTRTSIDSVATTDELARTAYDVDGALQAAINQMRNSDYDNDVTQTCPDFDFSGPNETRPITVTCQSATGTGAFGRTASNGDNRPPAALMTLGTSGEVGINQAGSTALTVSGAVASNSSIVASPGSLVVSNGQATARGSCTGVVTSTPAAACDTGTAVPDPAVAAPTDYAQPSAGMTYRPVPTCPTTAGETVKFLPGYYDDAVGLTELMSTCTGRTFWFQPATGGGVGVYYFDFRNGESPAFQGSTVWSITDSATRVVAGTPNGWNPDAAPRQVPSIPGSCVTPSQSSSNNGVEFVFGGRSQLSLAAGRMELCGQYYADKPPVAMYGAKTGADPAASTSFDLRLSTTANAGCDRDYKNQSRATYVDNLNATAATINPVNPTACITLTGFAPTSAVPAGAILTNATLIVDHRENSAPGILRATITPNQTRPGATALPATDIDVYTGSGTRIDTVDVTGALFDEVRNYGFSDASILYFVQRGSSNLTSYLDSVQLNLTWTAPALRAQNTPIDAYTNSGSRTITGSVRTSAAASAALPYSGSGTAVAAANCVGATPYPGSGACAFVQTSGSQTGFYVQGTAYAPLAAFDIAESNLARPAVMTGLVARKVSANLAAASGYPGPMIMLPPDTAGDKPVEVYFFAYVCPTGSTCSSPAPAAPWKLAGTALATYTDGGINPESGHRAVNVKSWEIKQ